MAGDRTIPTPRTIRFGPFELDVRAAELRKHGIRIRLHEQPFRILFMLLNRPGEVVLRDEIRQVLWPNNTIVEFDHSINAAIQRLRDALGDSADKPRYVETVARRGYRFIGTVEPEAAAPPDETPALPVAEPVSGADPSDLSGQTFSHFRVIAKLGSGSMGVVYRAEDLRLGRQVALKFLPLPAREAPPGLIERFQREARAASALNHPNICTIYGVEEFAGQPVIVMELLEGETLEARLVKGPLGLEKALPLALQLAEALDAAHRKGIVHRDLKPANIMLTRSGVKVLDFGLAKVERAIAGEQETLTKVTQEGTILGTWQYMSPEQAQGKDTDARSDIFSFGLVFYEMITGKRAFEGSNPASIIAAILEREAPPLEPEGLNRVVRACLAKDPAERFQSARDLQRAIEWSVSGHAATPLLESPPEPGRSLRLVWGLAALMAVSLATVAFLHFRERPPAPSAALRLQIVTPENSGAPILSPDGRKLAFIVGDRLWVQFLGSGESRELTATDGGTPFWSPDSRFIGYLSQRKLKKIEATGGPPQTVTDLRSNSRWGGGAWNQNDVIVFPPCQYS
jgi:serine/threonine protein kinase